MSRIAEVAELADALRSGRSEHYARVGSNPSFGTSSPDVGLFPSSACFLHPFPYAAIASLP